VHPLHEEDLAACSPLYDDLPGWKESIGGLRTWDELPLAARAYVGRIESLSGLPVRSISVGPEREQVIYRGTGQ
jgi:adenylosuccinate synthase